MYVFKLKRLLWVDLDVTDVLRGFQTSAEAWTAFARGPF